MSVKKTIISRVNQFIQTEVVPNKLEYLISIPEVSELDFDSLKLSDMYMEVVETSDKCGSHNEYTVICHVFEWGTGQTVELAIEEYNQFSGIRLLTNVEIWYDTYEGTSLFEKEPKIVNDFGLEDILNGLDYISWFDSNVDSEEIEKLGREIAKENLIPLEVVKNIFDEIVRVEEDGIGMTKLVFGSGASLNVLNEDIYFAERQMKSKK